MDKKLLKIFSEKWAIMPTEIENICSSDFGDPAWKDSNEPNHKNNVDIRDGLEENGAGHIFGISMIEQAIVGVVIHLLEISAVQVLELPVVHFLRFLPLWPLVRSGS